eukprot:762066-Hanusia_phi.AAC.2
MPAPSSVSPLAGSRGQSCSPAQQTCAPVSLSHLSPSCRSREVLGVSRTGLDQEFVSPAVEVFKRFRDVDVEDEDTAVGSAVEGYTQTLKPLLPSCVPGLADASIVRGDELGVVTCMVTSLSSTLTSLVKKSAPMVALYWLLNFLFTY